MSVEEIYANILEQTDQASQYHRRGQHTLALQSYQKAIALAVTLGDSLLMAHLLAEAGGEHRDNDNYYHAIDLMLAALALVPDDPTNTTDTIGLRARIKKLLAITFNDVYGASKSEVIQLLEESRADFARIGDKGEEGNVLQHLGDSYVELGRLSEADGMLQEALQKASEVNNVQLQGWILNDMAALEIEKEEWGLALDYTLKARGKVCTVPDLEGEADTWVTEARIRLRMNQTEEALLAANHALEIYIQNKNLRRSINAYRYVAQAFNKQDNSEEAINVLQKAMRIAERLDLPHYQVLLYIDLGKTEVVRKNYGIACQHALKAKNIIKENDLQNIEGNVDELLRNCSDTELHQQ
jgi:tetratricopeptide (TPR) repeat protein